MLRLKFVELARSKGPEENTRRKTEVPNIQKDEKIRALTNKWKKAQAQSRTKCEV